MKNLFTIIFAFALATGAFGQKANQLGPQFEESLKSDTVRTSGYPKVWVGGDFAMQFQALKHHADTARLIPLGNNLNLPTANFNLGARLADGIEVNLTTYLSSRHHTDAWVKGGYLLIDKLPFLNSPAVDRLMDLLTLRVGVMELNYGDAHFRRTDNGNALRNPFVGGLIMDAFTTAPALELYFNTNGLLLMGGLTTGSVNPAIVGYNAATKTYTAFNAGKELGFYGKVGYDKQITDDFRFRATLSGFTMAQNHAGSLYNGDRAGSRFYLVMQRQTFNPADVDISANFLTGLWGPGTTRKDNSLMANLFTKFHGLELFGTLEAAKGTTVAGADFNFKQYAVEGLYRFGGSEQFYVGAKYNAVKNQTPSRVNRVEVGAGYMPVKNIILKAEYVKQNYKQFDIYGGNGGFNGAVVEAAVSF
jgi:hypothetical protein